MNIFRIGMMLPLAIVSFAILGPAYAKGGGGGGGHSASSSSHASAGHAQTAHEVAAEHFTHTAEARASRVGRFSNGNAFRGAYRPTYTRPKYPRDSRLPLWLWLMLFDHPTPNCDVDDDGYCQ